MAFTRDMILDYVCSRLEANGYCGEQKRLLEVIKEPITTSGSMRKLKQIGLEYEQSEKGRKYLTSTADSFVLTGDFAQQRFNTIIENIFRGGDSQNDKWNKIMRAISVTSRLVIKAASQQNNTSIYNLINWLTRYMARNQDDWISTQGGWNAFLDYYPKEKVTFSDYFTSDEFKRMAGCGVAGIVCLTVLRKGFGNAKCSCGWRL